MASRKKQPVQEGEPGELPLELKCGVCEKTGKYFVGRVLKIWWPLARARPVR